MSGQWEVVGKKKEKTNPKVGLQTNKKKVENSNVKVEDVLAKSQVKNLYSNSNGKNEGKNKPVETKKVPESGPKKAQKKQEKPVDVPKPKAPKSIESALKLIDVDEFKSVFEKSKSHFPEAPIVWLKDLTHFLNQKINVEIQDPVFSLKPADYPINTVPSNIKSVIDKAIQEVNKSNLQLFFDISLTSMVTDMTKNQPALGHKLFLQNIAIKEPSLVTTNLSKHCVLRTSYQNRPNVGLSILWAVGQAGNNSFEAGFTIFQELMLPLIELKNYSRFIFKYLLDLLSSHNEVTLTRDQFVFILETIFSNKKHVPNDLKLSLIGIVPNLKSSLFSGNKKELFRNSLEFYLKKISTGEGDDYQKCLCDVIIEGFRRDPHSLEQWSKVISKNITASAILLRYIDSNWKAVSSTIDKKMLGETLKQIITSGNELSVKRKKDEELVRTVRTAEKLLQKMSEQKKSGSGCKYLFIATCLIITSVIYYDILQEGSWQKSNTNKLLKKSGVCEYTHLAINKAQEGLLIVDQQIETNFPTYRKAVIEFSVPYIELGGKLGRIFYNIFQNLKEVAIEKYPIVVQSVESYAPGLVEHSQNVVSNAWSSSVFYVNRSIDYLRKEVFVGQLSPENMQKVVYQAFNTTQIKATEYYHWLYEKVQSAIK